MRRASWWIGVIWVGLGACTPGPRENRDGDASGADSMAGMQGGGADGAMTGMSEMDMAGDGPIRITARQAGLAGVTFAVAREAPVERTVRAVGTAVLDEGRQGIVNARVGGWIEVLHADETGRRVRRDEPLLEIHSPELVTAQEELLLARRLASTTGGDTLIAAARRRLEFWDIADEDIAEIERTGTVRRRVSIRSPYSGHILEKNVIEGQMVRAGDRLFRIADLTTLWIEPAIFEGDIASVRLGQAADVTFDALPGHDFEGRVTFISPELDERTRTLRVRVELPNADLLVKPMMYGTVRIRVEGPRGVTVPLGAILPTGTRELAFVVGENGVQPTEVVTGPRGDSTVLVVEGLAAGDTVVSSSTFLFDSESQLGAAMAGIMLNMGMGLDMGGMQMDGMEMPGTDAGGADMPGMSTDSGGPGATPEPDDSATGPGDGGAR